VRADVTLLPFSVVQLSKIMPHPSAGPTDHRVILPSSLPGRLIFRRAKLAGPLHHYTTTGFNDRFTTQQEHNSASLQ
jgi:hypothetical protein